MKTFTNQIDKAASESKPITILGDAYLCSKKWEEHNFKWHMIASELLGSLAQNGLKIIEELGYTYFADRLSENGQIKIQQKNK